MLWDIQRFYIEEYEIGLLVLEWTNVVFKVQLLEDEAGLIALHIIVAKLNTAEAIVQKATQLIQKLFNFVRYYFKMGFSPESVSYFRFIAHLKFFAKRLFSEEKMSVCLDTG